MSLVVDGEQLNSWLTPYKEFILHFGSNINNCFVKINSKTDQYFAGETFDMIQQLPNGTYEIAMQRRYHAHNYTKYAGELSFHCNLLVLMTSWRMGIKYKLFGESGCVQEPPPIHNGNFFQARLFLYFRI